MWTEALSGSDTVSRIHPLNAKYLLDTQPHRLYGDRGGNLLEVIVERFASTVVETLYGHGGIIALGYLDATTGGEWSFHNTYILGQDGRIQAFHSQYGKLPIGIDLDVFYMLLNPVEMNNWFIQNPEEVQRERESFAKSGIGIKLPATSGATWVKQSIIDMRERYLQSLLKQSCISTRMFHLRSYAFFPILRTPSYTSLLSRDFAFLWAIC